MFRQRVVLIPLMHAMLVADLQQRVQGNPLLSSSGFGDSSYCMFKRLLSDIQCNLRLRGRCHDSERRLQAGDRERPAGRPEPTAQTASNPQQDLEGKTLSELHNIIIVLKTKHHREGVSAAERSRWVRARHVFEEKLKKLPHVKGVCSNDIIING